MLPDQAIHNEEETTKTKRQRRDVSRIKAEYQHEDTLDCSTIEGKFITYNRRTFTMIGHDIDY